MKREIKQGDVYRFRWSPTKEQGWDSRWHCFEGYLIALAGQHGALRLYDTFWGIKGDSNAHILTEEAIEKEVKDGGSFELYFNLDDYEKITEGESHYLADEDVVEISEQHRAYPSCVHHFKKKGATHSKDKMLKEIGEKIRKERQQIEWSTRNLEQLVERRTKIEAGDLQQYI